MKSEFWTYIGQGVGLFLIIVALGLCCNAKDIIGCYRDTHLAPIAQPEVKK